MRNQGFFVVFLLYSPAASSIAPQCYSAIAEWYSLREFSSLIVLDGDVYRSDEEKRKQILRKLTGTETDHDAKVERVLSAITEFCLPDKASPEKYIHEMITKAGPLTDKDREIMHCANEITVVKNSHEWLNGIIERMNRDRGIMLFQIV